MAPHVPITILSMAQRPQVATPLTLLELDAEVSGQLTEPGQVDWYEFKLPKNQQAIIQLWHEDVKNDPQRRIEVQAYHVEIFQDGSSRGPHGSGMAHGDGVQSICVGRFKFVEARVFLEVYDDDNMVSDKPYKLTITKT